MFSDEAAVTFTDFSGIEHSFFVSRIYVSEDHVTVEANVPKTGPALVVIPTPEPNTVVFVKKENLSGGTIKRRSAKSIR